MTPRILIADDEDAPREQLAEALAQAWPQARIVAQASQGADAWDAWLEHQPDLCFLDIRMPGMSGIEVAQRIDGRTPVVFVTAYGDHALAAFDTGAIDYLVKPVEPARLQRTVDRLQARLAAAAAAGKGAGAPAPARHAGDSPAHATEEGTADALRALLQRLVPAPSAIGPPPALWAAVGKELRLIDLGEVLYFESDSRYTRVVYRQDSRQQDALLRTPLKDLLTRLDPAGFMQVHRSVIVAVACVAAAVRVDDNVMELRLRGCTDRLPVSRPFQGLFKAQ
ncbi:MAG: LytR/AlgR family response regulator transcription factor [Aquabacterium sp.]